MKKIFLALITSLMFVGTAHALPQYEFIGGTETIFDSSNTFGILSEGQTASGVNIDRTSSYASLVFSEPTQVSFNTLVNTIPLAEGVVGITNDVHVPGRIFSNDDTALTLSPLQGAYYMWVTDYKVSDPNVVETSWSLSRGGPSDPMIADPMWSLIGLGDNSFLSIFQFDQGNASAGMWISEVSMPVMSPVPEPETYAMLLIGLGFVAYAVRKQRKDNVNESLRFVPVGA